MTPHEDATSDRRRRWALATAVAAAALCVSATARAETTAPRLTLSTADGSSSIRLRIAAQTRWQLHAQDLGTDAVETDNEILFRRLRIMFQGTLLSRSFHYFLHFNFVPGALELMDLWFDYRFHEQVAVRLGQQKVPFTRYRLGSYSNRPVLDWSLPTQWFGAERQIGVMIHNGVGAPGRFEYQLAVLTGVNARASNGVGMARAYQLPRPNASDLTDPAAPSSFHPELAAHLAYNHGDIDLRAPQDFEGGAPRFSVGASISWDARPEAGQDMSLRLAPELVVKMWGLTLWGVFYTGFFDEAAGDETSRLGFLGGVAQLGYVFLDRYEIGLRYTNVTLTRALRDDARALADARVADAPEEERDALAASLDGVGRLAALHDVTAGFNVFFLARTLKVGLDGGVIVEHLVSGENEVDLLVRTQAQLSF